MRAIFEQITADIMAAIEQGTERYEMPWHRTGAGLPLNALTREPYRGTNVLTLWAAAGDKDFSSNSWGAYRQWEKLGGQVRKGQRGSIVVFWKVSTYEDRELESEGGPSFRRFIARAARVFNTDQVDGAPAQLAVQPLDPTARVASAQRFFDGVPAVINFGAEQAFYDPCQDAIQLPHFAASKSASRFYSVLAHEMTHWTGPKHRLDRDLSGRFGSTAYAMEELVAELGASFLCAHLGIATEPRRDHAPYIASWLEVLRADPRALVSAASQAQAAVDFLIDHSRGGKAKLEALERELA